MPVYRISAFLSLVLLLLSFHLNGQDRRRNFFRLDEGDLEIPSDSGYSEVLAASRSLKSVDDLPVTVYVISRDEIIRNGYTTLVDALGSLPGIRVSRPGSAMDGETFQVRGIYGNYYCKILVDGVTIKPSVVSGMPIGPQLPIRQAERIEVIFGPASSVYGSEAMAGVINIVTHQSDRPVTAQADIALGSDGYEYLNVSIGGKAGKNKNVLTYSIFGGNSTLRDMNVKYDRDFLYNPSLYDSTYSFLDQPYYEGDSTSIRMGRLPSSSNLLGLSFKWRGWTAQAMRMSRTTHSSIGRDPSVYSYSNPLNFWSESIQRYRLSYEKKWQKISTETQVSWLNYRLANPTSLGLNARVGETGSAYKYAASDDLLIDQQLIFLPAPGLELVAGAAYQYSGNLPLTNNLPEPFKTENYSPFSTDPIPDTSLYDGFGLNPLTFHRFGAYLQIYYETGRFTLFGGLRPDYHSMFGWSYSPRISVMYRTEKELSIRASFSTASRVPSMYFMYNSLADRQSDGIFYSIVPNRDLKPEKLIAAEAGARWNRLKWFSLDAVIFYHRVFEQFTLSFVRLDPAEYPLAVNPGMLSRAYVNDENSYAEIIGLQTNFGFRRILPSIGLQADLNLTVSKGREALPNDLGSIGEYRQMPVLLGQFDIQARPVDRIRLLLRNNFSTGWVRGYLPLDPDLLRQIGYPVDIDGYYTLDVQAAFTIGRNFEAYAHFNNVTNRHYGGIDASSDESDLFYNPQYGFNFRIGLSFRME